MRVSWFGRVGSDVAAWEGAESGFCGNGLGTRVSQRQRSRRPAKEGFLL